MAFDWRAGLTAKLEEMRLWDGTGDPFDEGYQDAIAELEAWMGNVDAGRVPGSERDAWIRLFNELDAAINHHKRDTGDFATDADERLWKAQAKILSKAAHHDA